MAKKSQRQLAEMTGVSLDRVNMVVKKGLSEEETIEELNKIHDKMVAVNNRFKTVNSKNHKSSVRRIDKKDGSSVLDMLQDCKEQYVKNQEVIERLQLEIDNMENTTGGTRTGNFQIAPQFNTIERFQKVNIALRNQIVSLEETLGRTAEQQDEDPFA